MTEITGKKIEKLYIVGGGSNVAMLNQLTAKLAGIEVFAGPSEATAIGNLVVQMINQGEIESMRAGRKSFEIHLKLANFLVVM